MSFTPGSGGLPAGRGRAEPVRACPVGHCDGSGWILGPDDLARPCECRERRIARARSRGVASSLPPRFRGVSFDRPPVTEMASDPELAAVVAHVRELAGDVERVLDSGQGLWLVGDVGTGKTTLAMLLSKAALDAGRSVAIYSVPRLLAQIRRTYDAEPGSQSYLEFFDRLVSVDLLHLDDLGAEKRSDWVLEQLYAIVNKRYEDRRAITVTMNASESGSGEGEEDWLERLNEQIGGRTVSRLIEICGDPLPMYGRDNRVVAGPWPDQRS